MNFYLIVPEIIVLATALGVLVSGRKFAAGLSVCGLGLALLSVFPIFKINSIIFFAAYTIDPFSSFCKIAALLAGIIVILLSIDYVQKFIHQNSGEFYLLILFAVLSLLLITSSSSLIMIYIALEFLSLTSYVLAGYLKADKKSQEASLKYFLYGAAASAAFIYGISLMYGLTGSLNLYALAANFISIKFTPLVYISLLLLLSGFGFKIAMVPFQMWMPDVFEGAPTPIAAFLSIGPKVAGLAVLLRFLLVALGPLQVNWIPLLAVFSLLSMTLGNLAALPQKNIMRMLAYSGISQIGYLLIGIAASSSGLAVPAILFYLFIYLFMNLGAFAIVLATELDLIADYTGLSQRSPLLAAGLTIFFLSLAGIPPLSGFVAKFYIFAAALDSGYLWLAVIGILNSLVSVYYYLNVTRLMYFVKSEKTAPPEIPFALKSVIICLLVAVLVLGIIPGPLVELTQAAGGILFLI